MVHCASQNVYAILTFNSDFLKTFRSKKVPLILSLNFYQIFSYGLLFIGKRLFIIVIKMNVDTFV